MRIALTFALLSFFIFPSLSYAALININTASEATLETLPGIGPTIAGRIIDYRTANGPFASTAAIQNVSGIGPSTYAKFSSLITVSDGADATGTAGTDATSTSSTTTQASAHSYTPPPTSLTVQVQGPEQGLLEVPLSFSARTIESNGTRDTNAHIAWSFGDGSANTGREVQKIYHYPGTYLVVATAVDGDVRARDQIAVTVRAAQVRIAGVSGAGVTLENMASTTLDLSGWRLLVSGSSFRIPEGMMIEANREVLLPFSIMNLPIAFTATLLYADGITAAYYAPPVPAPSVVSSEVQPFANPVRSNERKTVEPISSSRNVVQQNDEAVLAPTVASELATVGAAFASASPLEATEAPKSPATGLLHSPWLMGLMGVITVAGGAFILL